MGTLNKKDHKPSNIIMFPGITTLPEKGDNTEYASIRAPKAQHLLEKFADICLMSDKDEIGYEIESLRKEVFKYLRTTGGES